MKIILLGYMASGKSTIGRLLAGEKNIPFIDLDAYIEDKEERTISDIFKTEGEIYFRLQENKYLKELLSSKDSFVLSLGGGTPCYGNNMDIITEHSKSFYLKASINTIFNRLKNETSQRPLVSTIGIDNLEEFIAKHLFERSVYYDQASEIINVNEKSIESIVSEIKLNLV